MIHLFVIPGFTTVVLSFILFREGEPDFFSFISTKLTLLHNLRKSTIIRQCIFET